ncbi:type II CRISPR RNA-guided endonuclease Cas9 [Sulfuritalea sp.]|uniref:type II CRISPR RNA-guided endonuclease Cas9 n=1 Tax=Sulfuritalea sp. TaxID=2480090 RepID=UPI001ACC824E|nr:type II CRISPR RNA-guided endonuclease Cas9 [Sulfuritalea sp.]MBN8475726.1 type II CRISPR RNA-guided endonuclease Cas9 [Sulfuritalea sp.]
MTGNTLGPLTFGFDIGIASVGWCVLGENRIVDMGARCFDSGEDSDGKPHNQTRRGARVARNRLHMRRWRLRQLLRLFCDTGIIDRPDPKLLMTPPGEDDPWQLRAKGLKGPLEPIEWACVLYHLVKHRGFEFFRKSELMSSQTPDAPLPDTSEEKQGKVETPNEEAAAAKEKEKLNNALKKTSDLLEKYRKLLEEYHQVPLTVGSLLVWLVKEDYARGEPQPDTSDRITSIRNKSGSYRHAFFRAVLRRELHELFAAQTLHGNPYTTLDLPADGEYARHMLAQDNSKLTPEKAIPIGSESRPVGQTFQQAVFDLFDLQHPPLYGEQIREMVGKCELIEGQPRASKNAFSSERATWLETLNKLRVRRDGKETPLSTEERAALINLPYEPHKVTLKLVRETLMARTGFPASWQEASFNVASYQAKPANDGAWIFIASRDQEFLSLAKWASTKERKDKLKEAKKMLMGGIITFRELRKQLGLADSDRFVSRIKDTTIIPHDKEAYEHLQFPSDGNGLFAPGHFFRCISNNGKPKVFPKIALKLAADLRSQSAATLADWRKAIATMPSISGTWQFEHSISTEMAIEPKDEAHTQVPLKFEDAQAVEADHKLVELKGWHALRLALAERCPDKWAQLQVAYQRPTSDEGQRAAHEIDDIATILTEAQTDHEIEMKLRERGCTDAEEIDALKSVGFSKFRNLSLAALHRILPHLEDGHVYSKACELADLSHSEKKAQVRGSRLPPLKTCVYQRYRHGMLTGHKENRYKELLNPVVARSFNQARLVFNDLVTKHGSPTYVHVETARDLARSKKMRDKISREQDTNRKRIESIRNDLKNKLGREPSGEQLLKRRLYLEQNGQCLYTGRSLEPYIDAMLTSDENVVEIDHIWPRSKTFDNSLDNRVLVIAGANQNKRNQIPYEFFNGAGGDPRWREFEIRVLACKGISAEKQRRLLSKSLEDADEFLARNLVDTRYATRLFSAMLRERVMFAGGATPEELEAISPDDDGKTRWNRYQRARVRSPQGRLVDFLRGKWGFAHLKDREKSDLHHALDACIIAACSPKTIQQVNNYFAEEEQEPGKHSFKRNSDGTYTHRATRKTLSKEEAVERGLYLPAPWKPREVMDALNKVFVSRRPKRKSATEIHDANPKGMRYLPVPLVHLTEEMLSAEKLREITGCRRENYETLLTALQEANGDAQVAFADGYDVEGKHGKLKRIYSIAMPLWSLPDAYRKQRDKELTKENARRRKDAESRKEEAAKLYQSLSKTARKTVPLTNLTQKMLTEAELGSTFYQRNRELIDVLKAHLGDKKAKDAFAQPFQPPSGKKGKKRPVIRSIRLPDTHGSGMLVRGGITGLGESISTEVWMTESGFFFRPRYLVAEETTFGLEEPPIGARHLFNLRIDEPIEVVLTDGEIIPGNGFPGYFVMYEGDKRIKIRTHDRPGKGKRKKSEEETGNEDETDNSLWRISISGVKELKKYRVDALGNFKLVANANWSGVA